MITNVEKMMSIYPAVGQRLRWLRTEMDLAQKPIADHCSVTQSVLSRKERGVEAFTRSEVASYVAYLNGRLSSVTSGVVDCPLTYELVTDGAVDAPGIEVDAVEFSVRLKLLRQLGGLSVEYIAQQVEVDPRSVYGWLRGETLPAAASAERLCELLSRSVDGFESEMLIG